MENREKAIVRPMVKNIIRLVLFPLLLLSCREAGLVSLKVLTDQKDTVIVGEHYNTAQDENRLVLIYDAHITPEDVADVQPDILIGGNLNNPEMGQLFLPLNVPEGIYPQLVGPLEEGKTCLIPLAFDLPVILYSSERTEPLIMDGDTLKAQSLPMNRKEDDRFVHMGFSPLWSSEFIYWFLQSRGIRFSSLGKFDYDHDRLEERLLSIESWIEDNSETLAADEEFTARYRYIPDYKLLRAGYLDYVPMTFSRFASLPEAETVNLTHSWFGGNGRIYPQNLVYAALYAKTDKKEGAADFLNWLVSARVQRELLARKGSITTGFALFDRFSSLEEINRAVLPSHFPRQLGDKMFLPRHLKPPPEEPVNWSAIKTEVLFPWLNSRVRNDTVLSLQAYYKEWSLLFID